MLMRNAYVAKRDYLYVRSREEQKKAALSATELVALVLSMTTKGNSCGS